MNKWVVFTLFYVAIAVSLSHESTPWVRLAWLAPILALWIVSFGAACWSMKKKRHSPHEEWRTTDTLSSIIPKSWRDWIMGEGKYRSGRN